MTKQELLDLINQFITALGYNPSEVQMLSLNTQGYVELSTQSTDPSTGKVLNRSERINWVPVQNNQLTMSNNEE